MPDRIVVGVDGGGTKTEAIVTDASGRVLGRGLAGPSNWEVIGLDGLLAAVTHALDDALGAAEVARSAISASAFALAGVDWPSDETRLRPGLASLGLGGELVLVNDAFAAMRAGCDEPFGAVSNAGTGTVTAARNRTGESARTLAVLGYGERGGASDLVDLALHAIARAHHRQTPPTLLTERILEAVGCATPEALFEAISRDGLSVGSELAPVVLAAAAEGDRAAAEIARQLGRDLGAALVATVGRVGMRDDAFRVVRSGGVHRADSALLDAAFAETVLDGCPHAEITLLDRPPAIGAALLALDALTGPPPASAVPARERTRTQMAREIEQQPDAVERTVAALEAASARLADAVGAAGITRVLLIARGTSDNACVYARYLLEARCGLVCSLAAPSLYTRYHAAVDLRGTLAIAVSQSGETPEIVDALEYAREHGALTAAVTNGEGSSLATAAEHPLITRAGEERSVAATKTFTTQLAAFASLAGALGAPGLPAELARIPGQMRDVLADDEAIEALAVALAGSPDALCVARGFSLAVAFEAALKLKETAGIWAEGYSSADLLHGPRAAVRPGMPALVLRSSGAVDDELGELERLLEAAEAQVLRVRAPDDVCEELAPLLLVLPAQRAAERAARQLGRDPDRPRGLTKVTPTR